MKNKYIVYALAGVLGVGMLILFFLIVTRLYFYLNLIF